MTSFEALPRHGDPAAAPAPPLAPLPPHRRGAVPERATTSSAPVTQRPLQQGTAPAPTGSRIPSSSREIHLRNSPTHSRGGPTTEYEKQHAEGGIRGLLRAAGRAGAGGRVMVARVAKESVQRGQRLRDRAAPQAAVLREPRAAAAAARGRGPGDAWRRQARDSLLAALGGGHRRAPHRDGARARGARLRPEAPHPPGRARPPSAGRRPRSSSRIRCSATPGSRCRQTPRGPGRVSASRRPTTACPSRTAGDSGGEGGAAPPGCRGCRSRRAIRCGRWRRTQ